MKSCLDLKFQEVYARENNIQDPKTVAYGANVMATTFLKTHMKELLGTE